MSLIRRDPFQDFSAIHNAMNRYLENIWPRWRGIEGINSPRADVYQTENEVIATVELPGIDSKDDIDLRIHDDVLSIHAEVKRSQDYKEEQYAYNERFYGTVSRVIQLPAPVKPDETKASYNNGVLEVRMAKREPGNDSWRRIPVQ